MIYLLLYPMRGLSRHLSWLNVLRYIPFRAILATLTAMAMSFAMGPWFIRRLQEKQIGQVVRSDGPETHFKKRGTPTMGGSLILFTLVLPTVLWADPHNTFVWLTLVVTVTYGVIGFIDDYLKIKHRDSRGLAERYKLLGQAVVALFVVAYLYWGEGHFLPADWLRYRHQLAFPFVGFRHFAPVMPVAFWLAFGVFMLLAWSNAVNLTDGLDGLAIGPVIINAGTYVFYTYVTGATFARFQLAQYLNLPPLQSTGELAIYCGAMIGSGVGFLWFNTYPASVFMGDVGALALGGGLGMLALITKNEFLSAILGGIFVVEAVSVLIQRGWFKYTRFRYGEGQRIFLMAPIHHHFEKKGWAEPKVIVRFWIIAIILALISLSNLKLR
ncbi:MAG: phospho-N-acetylmuramoyl-pentapeptide-transferase [Deltaproteobacteria bacterium]|nr:phospho-N-acetylmuramoyl-pentapeptide-transferase [Deltaproteobacteria bacterium]